MNKSAGRVSAALALAAVLLVSGCASRQRWDDGDFPVSVGGVESVAVDWSGTVRSISPGAPEAVRTLVTLHQGGRWTIKVRVESATPVIPPFVRGWTVSLRVEDPLAFFGSNSIATGDVINRSFEIWRGDDGKLYARRR